MGSQNNSYLVYMGFVDSEKKKKKHKKPYPLIKLVFRGYVVLLSCSVIFR